MDRDPEPGSGATRAAQSQLVELFQRHRGPHAQMSEHLQEARWTVRNLEQRFSTILSVAQAILKRQQHFLGLRSKAMKPIGLREIADEVGVHESTVSRVTNNKFMATPVGVFELKYSSRAGCHGERRRMLGHRDRGLIQEMIAAETPARRCRTPRSRSSWRSRAS